MVKSSVRKYWRRWRRASAGQLRQRFLKESAAQFKPMDLYNKFFYIGASAFMLTRTETCRQLANPDTHKHLWFAQIYAFSIEFSTSDVGEGVRPHSRNVPLATTPPPAVHTTPLGNNNSYTSLRHRSQSSKSSSCCHPDSITLLTPSPEEGRNTAPVRSLGYEDILSYYLHEGCRAQAWQS